MGLKQIALRPVAVLSILVLAAALFSISTWDQQSAPSPSPKPRHTSQLIDQSAQVEDIQASPSKSSLSGGSSSANLQNTQPVSDQPVSSDELYPKDPCGLKKVDNTSKITECDRP